MLLAVDIGNTNIVLGLFSGDQLQATARLSTRERMTSDEAGFLIDGFLRRSGIDSTVVTHSVVGSVVPRLTGALTRALESRLPGHPVVVTSSCKLPMSIEIDRPAQLGADRIANGVAGLAFYGKPLIVVDFGTATTFDVVDANNRYLGGVIIPGPETSMKELARKAAQLHEISLVHPSAVVGKSTELALQSGLFYGTLGQVDRIVDEILRETGFSKCHIVATGGLAYGIEEFSRHVELVEPTLTLHGLRIIGEMNRE
ncbi:MAG TPA: type III pantothenate kinase [candidate division Zixibacteria bacterium]|nr:type III pantothenate kinase [candidate division Zixibacteria bacterium]